MQRGDSSLTVKYFLFPFFVWRSRENVWTDIHESVYRSFPFREPGPLHLKAPVFKSLAVYPANLFSNVTSLYQTQLIILSHLGPLLVQLLCIKNDTHGSLSSSTAAVVKLRIWQH